MRFKNFTFPHAPEKLEVSVKNNLGIAHCPGYGPVIQELGVQQRTITGEGAFFGPDAATLYRRLESLFFQQTPGRLSIPGHPAITAHFVRLRWLGQGDGQIIRYGFEFVERPGSGWSAK